MKSADDILWEWETLWPAWARVNFNPHELKALKDLIDITKREARKEALEEAERVVDAIADKYRKYHFSDYENIADECAGEIRALINQDKKEE